MGYWMRARDLIKFLEADVPLGVSMDQAKERWKSTLSILPNDVKDAYGQGEFWLMLGDFPVVFSADKKYIFYFASDKNGQTVGWQGIPPGFSRKQANYMLQGGVDEKKPEIFKVHIVKTDGTVIQRMSGEDFMKAVGTGRTEFLKDAIDKYNSGMAAKGTKAVIALRDKNEQTIKYRGYQDCPACGGVGGYKVGLNGPPEQCPTCKGSGMTVAKNPLLINLGAKESPRTDPKHDHKKKNTMKDPSFL